MRLLGALAAALVLAPAAGAWTRLTPEALVNTAEPSVFRLSNGVEIVGWRDDHAGAVRMTVLPGDTVQTIVSGYANVGTPRFVQLPDGSLAAYFGGTGGVSRLASADGGATWSAPALTVSKDTGEVTSAAVRPDGTPLFLQEGTGYLNLFQGPPGAEIVHNLFVPCCAYAGTVAVDSGGLAQIAFWSNATSPNGFVYEKLGAEGSPGGPPVSLSGNAATIPRDDRVPLVADRLGNTFLAWSAGYPTSTELNVTTFRGGASVGKVKVAVGGFAGPDPHMALAVDPANRLWAVWTRGGAVWAARSRTAGASFGAPVRSGFPGRRQSYRLAALATGAGLDAFLNLSGNPGSALWMQHLLPGLTIVVGKTAVRVLDDGFPVAGALLRGGRHTARTDSSGSARLAGFPERALVKVTKAGYAPVSLRLPRPAGKRRHSAA